MKNSEELFQLIKSLSGPEKRHFKLISSKYEGEKHYVDVFNILVKQKNYDEQALRKKIKNKAVFRQLHRIKSYLYKLVLKTISDYNANNSEKSRINKQLEQIQLLMARGLLKHSRKLISKSKKLAYSIGYYPVLIELLKLEKRICINTFELEKVKAIEAELKTVWDHTQLVRNYEELNDKMFTLISKEGKARNNKIIKQAEKIIHHPLLANEKKAGNHQAKHYYYQIHYYYAYFKGDVETGYNYGKAQLSHMESQPAYLMEFQSDHIIILNNLLIFLIDLKKYDELRWYLQKLKTIQPVNRNNKIRIFRNVHTIEQEFYIKIGEFEKGILREKDVIKGMEEYGEKIPLLIQFILLFNLSLLNFGVSKYSKALQLLNKAMNLPYMEQRQDMQALGKIFNLIVHFELGNEMLFPYLVRSTYRYLLKQQRIYKYETFILQFIRRLPKASSPRKMKEAFIELKSALEKLQNDSFEKHAFGNFDIISWLESKIEKRNFADCVRRRAFNVI